MGESAALWMCFSEWKKDNADLVYCTFNPIINMGHISPMKSDPVNVSKPQAIFFMIGLRHSEQLLFLCLGFDLMWVYCFDSGMLLLV